MDAAAAVVHTTSVHPDHIVHGSNSVAPLMDTEGGVMDLPGLHRLG